MASKKKSFLQTISQKKAEAAKPKTEEKKYSGYGYHGGGRKATGIKRVSFSVSCQPEELEKIKELAAAAGKTVSKFLLDLALNK